jgi:hypothetical protein
MIALQDFRYKKRHPWSPIATITDIADYQVGYVFSLWPVTIIKVKTSKIMEAPKYVIFIKISSFEYQKAWERHQ